MADTVRSQLEAAYRLIQDERLDEANKILHPILAKDRNNADAWWLLANAVTEPDDAREALDNVLRLDPKHTQARDLLAKLDEVSVPGVGRKGDILGAAGSPSDADFNFDNVDDFFGGAPIDPDIDEPDFLGGATKSAVPDRRSPRATPSQPMARRRSPPRSALLALAAIVIIVIVAGVYLFIIAPGNVAAPGSTRAVPTLVANAPTETTAATMSAVATSAVTPAATSISSSANALSAAVQTTTAQFQANGFPNAKAALSTSSLGQTLTVTVCSAVGPKFPATVDKARDLLATQAATVGSAIAAIGLTVTNCTDATKNLYKGVAAISDVTAFVNKSMTAAQFHKVWKVG